MLFGSSVKIMDIKYLGHSSFRIRGKNAALVTDPFDPGMVGFSFPKVTADVVTVSHEHPDHNQTQLVAGRVEGLPAQPGKSAVVVRGPGEYEVNGIKIYGYPTFHDSENGSKRGKNTIYLLKVDGVNILHCGDLGHILSDALLEEIDEVHILLVPTGGFYTINEKEALAVVRQVDPSIVIPMHYKQDKMKESFGSLSTVDAFLKEIGKTGEVQPKLTITHDKLPEELEVIVLSR